MNHDAIAHARACLAAYEAEREKAEARPFLRRSAHIERVCVWLERLLQREAAEDARSLRLAAAFHDVGYAVSVEDHGAHGVEMMRAYAAGQGLDQASIERAAFLMREHSNKDRWLPDCDAPRDLVLLMEADLLDGEGAMGIVCDCMSAAVGGARSYEDAYARMLRFEPLRLAKNPMVTPTAKAFWAEKQQIIRTFMDAFAYDMGQEP